MDVIHQRHRLEAELHHHQTEGSMAAQAEVLVQLAALASEEDEFNIAHALYGQAWAVYDHLHDVESAVRMMLRIAVMQEFNRPIWESVADIRPWYEVVLTEALTHGTRVNQAEVYRELGHQIQRLNPAPWLARGFYILAYALYHIVGAVPDDVPSPNALSSEVGRALPRGHWLRDQFDAIRETRLAQLEALNDWQAVAYSLMFYGELMFLSYEYDTARQDFDRAWNLLTALGDQSGLILLCRRYLRFAHRLHDYDLYKHYHARLIGYLRQQSPSDEIMDLWAEQALLAVEHGDWEGARHAYQSGLPAAVHQGDAWRQISIYWQWGQMEFYKTGRRAMGLALCQRSVTLAQHYTPEQTAGRERELRLMKKDM